MNTTKYWIVTGDTHDGPFTAEELVARKASPDSYVWHEGLPTWTQIKDVPELSELFVTEEIVQEPEKSHDTIFMPTTPPPPPPLMVEEEEPVPYRTNLTTENVGDTSEQSFGKCPPSYLAWSIITTILFFLPLGIVAIIYSSKVKSAWYSGDTQKAYKSSEMAAWFSNIAFVTGLIWMPFSFVLALFFL